MKSGWASTGAHDVLLKPSPKRGTHGYDPAHPELLASLIMAGPDVVRRGSLGQVRMTRIAPAGGMARPLYHHGNPTMFAGASLMTTSTTRRAFLTGVAAAMAAPAILRARRVARYPISFSTLGCPAWSWARIVEQAGALGFAGIEVRGVAGEMDLSKVPEFSPSRIADTRRDLAALNLTISDLGASAHMHAREPQARQVQFDEGRRHIDVAHALGVKYVRMFGDKVPEGENKADVIARVADGFRQMAAHAKGSGVTVLIESHGDFTSAADLEQILRAVDSDAFALLWDAHHTFASGHEQPADTYAKLRSWIRHTHLKDSRPGAKGREYVLTGEGDVPVKEQVRVLASNGYTGFYGFEWEKRWHPEIPPAEVAFPHYARVIGEYLSAAGVSAAD